MANGATGNAADGTPDPHRFTLSDTLLVAVIPAAGYAIVALFQTGLFRFFNLPYELNKPDVTAVFNVLGSMFRIAFLPGINLGWGRAIDVLLALPLLALIWPKLPFIGVPDDLLKTFPRVIAVPCLLCFFLTPVVSAPWDLVFFAILGTYLAVRIRGHIEWPDKKLRIGTWTASRHAFMWKPDESTKDAAGLPFWKRNLWVRIGTTTFRVVLVALVLMPDAYYLGYETGARSQELYVAKFIGATGIKDDYQVISVNGDTVVGLRLSDYPRVRNLRYSGSFALIKLHEGNALPVSLCTIDGPIVDQPHYFYVYARHDLTKKVLHVENPDCDVF